MVKFLKEKTDLTRISSVLSLFTLVAFHWPFFRLVLGNIEGGFNGVLITGGLGVLMFALNFLAITSCSFSDASSESASLPSHS